MRASPDEVPSRSIVRALVVVALGAAAVIASLVGAILVAGLLILGVGSLTSGGNLAEPANASSQTEVASAAITPSTTAMPAEDSPSTVPPSTAAPTTVPTVSPTTTTTTTTIPRPTGTPRPDWLGQTPLHDEPSSDFGRVVPAPPELIDRRFWTLDHLPPPAGDTFESSIISPPPLEIIARSTWRLECPVVPNDLAYAQVSFFGFDGLFHTGEFILEREITPAIVDIFEQLHAERFPIEEMRVTSQTELDTIPTGDDNNTASFVCRRSVGGSGWSRHAFGGAIDINPFQNPYVRGDRVIPEMASAYVDRTRDVPGMLTADIAELFADVGWGWGGNWRTVSDWMHFSDTAR